MFTIGSSEELVIYQKYNDEVSTDGGVKHKCDFFRLLLVIGYASNSSSYMKPKVWLG